MDVKERPFGVGDEQADTWTRGGINRLLCFPGVAVINHHELSGLKQNWLL